MESTDDEFAEMYLDLLHKSNKEKFYKETQIRQQEQMEGELKRTPSIHHLHQKSKQLKNEIDIDLVEAENRIIQQWNKGYNSNRKIKVYRDEDGYIRQTIIKEEPMKQNKLKVWIFYSYLLQNDERRLASVIHDLTNDVVRYAKANSYDEIDFITWDNADSKQTNMNNMISCDLGLHVHFNNQQTVFGEIGKGIYETYKTLRSRNIPVITCYHSEGSYKYYTDTQFPQIHNINFASRYADMQFGDKKYSIETALIWALDGNEYRGSKTVQQKEINLLNFINL